MCLLAAGQLGRELVQLRVPVVQLGRPVAEHLLDGDAKLARPLLTPLEIRDGRGELLGARLELAAALGDELLDRRLDRRARVREQVAQPVPDAVVGVAPAGLPVPFPVARLLAHAWRWLVVLIHRS